MSSHREEFYEKARFTASVIKAMHLTLDGTQWARSQPKQRPNYKTTKSSVQKESAPQPQGRKVAHLSREHVRKAPAQSHKVSSVDEAKLK